MAIDPKKMDSAFSQTLRNATYIDVGCFVLLAAMSLWRSPDLVYMAFAVVSGVSAFIAKCYYWRRRSFTTGFITAMAWLIPYLIARQIVYPRPHGIFVFEYVALSIAIVNGFTWIFRKKIRNSRHDI